MYGNWLDTIPPPARLGVDARWLADSPHKGGVILTDEGRMPSITVEDTDGLQAVSKAGSRWDTAGEYRHTVDSAAVASAEVLGT